MELIITKWEPVDREDVTSEVWDALIAGQARYIGLVATGEIEQHDDDGLCHGAFLPEELMHVQDSDEPS